MIDGFLKLAAAHLVLGGVAVALAAIELPDVFGLSSLLPPYGLTRVLIAPAVASVFCQAVLLAFWGTFSRTSIGWRTVGLVAGVVYLESPTRLVPMSQEFLGLSTMTLAVTTVLLLAARALGARLARQDESGRFAVAEVEGFQFPIQNLMLFVAAVAVLTTLARGLRASLPHSPAGNLLLTAVWALCIISIGLAALGAELGDVRSSMREKTVLGLSPLLGAFFARAADAHPAGFFYVILTMLLYALLLLGSLRFVRSCGWRLARRSGSVSVPADAAASS